MKVKVGDKISSNYEVYIINLKTRKEIKWCIAANDIKGTYEVFKIKDGKPLFNKITGRFDTVIKKGNIKIVLLDKAL